MALTNVTPNRMTLLRLKRRLKMAKRGHKLLKDKLEGLRKEFMTLIDEYKSLKDHVTKQMDTIETYMAMADAASSDRAIERMRTESKVSQTVEASVRYVLSIPIPSYKLTTKEIKLVYPTLFVSSDMDLALSEYVKLLEDIIRLAVVEKALHILAEEMEKTKRRVNALEYTIIPQTEEAIKMIELRLDEMERSHIVRLMKIKETLAKKEGGVRSA
ncbi:V-type ATP synthase subunit D [bacterium 3DAC]|nr:V-type ATP synthase subunit D [Dictyoglomota bacterium]UZN23068.1 V-type ATP synthase subunit D [bacterium 3DAC]